MKRILLAVLFVAAPAFARDHDRDGWDQGSWSDDGQSPDGYGDEQSQSDWSQPDDDSWQSSPDDSGYTAESGPTFDDFRGNSELTWTGEWIDTPEYGTVWRPTHVAADWQPYTYGRWVWTNAGWAWASDEPFGWAVYHYGRWAWSPAAGWMWVPGRVWAPAWVTWRWTDGYAAWCPMGVRNSYAEHPAVWVVVPTRTFLEPVAHHVVPRSRRRIFPLPMPSALRTGPAVALIERATGRAVRPLPIGDARSPSAARAGLGSVIFYRPHTAPIARPARGAQPEATPQGPRAVPPNSGPGRPQRPRWFGAPSPSQPVAAEQRPVTVPPASPERPFGHPQRPAVSPPVGQPQRTFGQPQQPLGQPQRPAAMEQPAAVPHATPGAPSAPHATAPNAGPNGEQPQVKER